MGLGINTKSNVFVTGNKIDDKLLEMHSKYTARATKPKILVFNY
jgi:hypothetical protein